MAAAMEDYVHHFAIRLDHDGRVVTAVEVVPQRVPWADLPAGGRRPATASSASPSPRSPTSTGGWAVGPPSACTPSTSPCWRPPPRCGAPTAPTRCGCTGSGHDEMAATLVRDGVDWATWRTVGLGVVDEGRFAGLTLDRARFSAWIEANLDTDDREAAFVLRRGADHRPQPGGRPRRAGVRPDDARPADGSCFTYAPPQVHEATITMSPRPTERDGRGTPIPVADRRRRAARSIPAE